MIPKEDLENQGWIRFVVAPLYADAFLELHAAVIRWQREAEEWIQMIKLKYPLARDGFRTLGRTLVCVLCMGYMPFAIAQPQDPFDELQARISQLERDNQELRTALSKPDDTFVPMISELPPSPEDSGDTANNSTDRKMESLVEGLIKRMDEQAKAGFELRSQKIAALEREVKALNKTPKPTGMKANFNNGSLNFVSNDGNFKTHLGGTVQLDFIAPESTAAGIGGYGPPNTNLTQDSTNFRRLRMRADGTIYGWVDWAVENEYSSNIQNTSNNAVSLPDNGLRSFPTGVNQQGGNTLNGIQAANVWVQFKEIPVLGNIRVGNQLDWFGMEHVAGGRFLDFMERAPISDVFTGPNNNGFTPGVSAFNTGADKTAGLQLGIYKDNAYDSAYTFDLGNSFMYAGRAVWLPYYDEQSEGRYMVHTAFGAEYRTFDTALAAGQAGENIRVRSRGDLRIVSSQLTPNFADTGNFFASSQELINPEIAVVWGPWLLQAEYTTGWFNGARTTQLAGGQKLNNVMMNGGYAEALYFITGENRIYDRVRGAFGQTKPKNNVDFSQGHYGAWQVGVRYDWVDLNSGLISGGRNQNGTIGVNWFLNPHVRFQFNTVFSYIDNVATTNAAGNGLTAVSNAAGALNGSKFTGDGLIVTLGTRMDINF